MQCIDSQPNILGESPLWDHREGRLYFVDIESSLIHALHIRPLQRFPAAVEFLKRPIETFERMSWSMPSKPTSLALHSKGGLLVALSQCLVHFVPETGEIRLIEGTQIEGDVRFNDGKCDAQGRFWVGTMDLQEKDPKGKLYCLDNKGRLIQKEQDIIISNGLGWSPDQKTMYFTDSPRRTIYCYDFNLKEGTISNRRIFAKISEDAGYPDGLCVDQEGYVFSAHFMAGRITRYSQDGRVDQILKVPALCPTSCCIGGGRGKQLFITTATRDLMPEDSVKNPLNGGIFMFELNVAGEREIPFMMSEM